MQTRRGRTIFVGGRFRFRDRVDHLRGVIGTVVKVTDHHVQYVREGGSGRIPTKRFFHYAEVLDG